MPTVTYDRFDGGIDLSRPANIQSANRFRVLQNAYITPGKTVKKRPGARYRWSWGPGVKGLFAGNGYLTGFFGMNNPGIQASTAAQFNQSQGRFQTTELRRATGANAVSFVRTAFRFGGHIYVVADTADGTRHFYTEGNGNGTNDVTAADCPHGPYAIGHDKRVFAVSSTGVVRFSKINDAQDWAGTDDAGFLPTNNQIRGAFVPKSLAVFDGKLLVLYSDSAQMWTTASDPLDMAFNRELGVGVTFEDAHANVGSDLFFLSPSGVRSITLQTNSGNAMDLDVGVPVDRLIKSFTTPAYTVFGRYLLSLGQYWLINGNSALVYSFSRTAKVYAWSLYTFPWKIVGAVDFDGSVWLRSEAGDIYELDDEYPYDDDAEYAIALGSSARVPAEWAINFPKVGARLIEVKAQIPFVDFKAPASLKQIMAMDIVATREPVETRNDVVSTYSVEFLFRSQTGQETALGGPVDLYGQSDDTRPDGVVPLGIMAPAISPIITHAAPEHFELSAFLFHFENLGVV